VSDQLELAGEHTSVVEPAIHRSTAARVVPIVVVLALLVGGGIAAAIRDGGSGTRNSQPTAAASLRAGAEASGVPRRRAIRALLRRRSAAIVDHDQAAFMATVDPVREGFRRSQAQMFADLAAVRFASWSYRIDGRPAPGAPVQVALHYRIAGFDAAPTDLTQYPTFVQRSGHWYLASLADHRARGEISATDLWDYGPVHAVRRGSVLVLGAPSQQRTMVQVARLAQAAIPQVISVWGRHWSRGAVIEVPSTQREMGLIAGDQGDLDQIAALTSAEVSGACRQPSRHRRSDPEVAG
jgi:hypothetical protein